MHHPLNLHFRLLKRVLHYIQALKSYGIPIVPTDLQLTAYCDLDWAGDVTDRKSITGFCIFLGSILVSWGAKKQNSVARSSTEVEYMALTSTAAELAWIHQLLAEMVHPLGSPTILYCDNSTAIAFAHNPILHAKTKHIDLYCHFIRDCIKKQHI